jgi:type II secretion system protein J
MKVSRRIVRASCRRLLRVEEAFTLIEVMVAMVAFAIILAAINGIFWGALKLRNRTADHVDAALPVEHALAVIKSDLASIVPPGGTFFGELQSTITSTNTTMTSLLQMTDQQQGRTSPQFFTSSGRVDDSSYWSDVQMVSYYLQAPTNRDGIGSDLYRQVTHNLLRIMQMNQTEVDAQPILSGVQKMNFYFYDGTTWKETWDSLTEIYKLPKAIKVEITMASETRGRGPAPLDIVVPLIDAGTNDFSQATQ